MSAIGDFFNKILSVFSSFGISDSLDILFVVVIFFGCIRIIRETRAMQLAKGILLLLVMYGIEATAKIRTMSADIPIIAVTAHAFYTEQKQALAAGCNEVVSKPYSMEQLKVAIEKYI